MAADLMDRDRPAPRRGSDARRIRPNHQRSDHAARKMNEASGMHSHEHTRQPDGPSSASPSVALTGGSARVHPSHWAIAAALWMIAAALVFRSEPGGAGAGQTGAAYAQASSGAGLRGVYSFSAELAKGVYGVCMVDVDTMTLWCYEYSREQGGLRLAAARSWKYDRYLENFNAGDPPPDVVQKMVEDERAYRMQANAPVRP